VQAEELGRVNGPGLAALREYLCSGQAVAFLGAGASAPLYPLWSQLIGELVEAASGRLTDKQAAACQVLATSSPEAAAEIVRHSLGPATYLAVLRRVLRVRTDLESGRSWTPVQELVCRCTFKAVVTTNYDPGIVDARMRVRPRASATGFMTWEDELGLDRWRTGDIFGEAELPVLFAHGQHNRPDSVVLATTEYRRAYAGKLPEVLTRLMDGHLVWIGFSFADQRITAILREIGERTGTRVDPGGEPRHIAVMAWDPDAEGNDPQILALRSEIEYGALVVLYPAPGGDHSALALLLATLTDDIFRPAGDLPAPVGKRDKPPGPDAIAGAPEFPVKWVPGAEPVAHFTGRAEELARLDRWATDPQVALVGVSAWGGAGKTALVTHWVKEGGRALRRPGLRGVFGWSFYADPSAEHWAEELLKWASQDLGIAITGTGSPAAAVLGLLQVVPLLLVLDGLEVVQEGPAGDEFGRLLDGTLRETLAGACQLPHGGLLVLTSRFPFADLETFDGGSARMLELPPFTPAEGAVLLADFGGGWLAEDQRRELVAAVDGHALATGVLAGLLAARLPASDLASLSAELAAAARTDARVDRVLRFYSTRLAEADRYLLAAVSLFARPVSAAAVLAVAGHKVFGSRLAGWAPAMVEVAVRGRLAGLASWHLDETMSAHPLIRDTFRPLVLDAAESAAETALAGMPAGEVASRADALRVVEAIELLLDAGQWQAADDLNRVRTGNGEVWKHLPAMRLGQRAAHAFVATPARRDACANHLGSRRRDFYLSSAGLFALYSGDLTTAREFLPLSTRQYRDGPDTHDLAISLVNLADCYGQLGNFTAAHEAAEEALSAARSARDRGSVRASHAYLGWLSGLRGDTTSAESHFAAADQIEVANDPDGAHLYSVRGIWWAEWLARTARPGPARALTDRNLKLCRKYGWNQDVARCQGLLGRLELAAGDAAAASKRLAAAATASRDGDLLTELATILVDLAEHARLTGDLQAAERYATEAITIATSRGLVPIRSTALSARARIRASMVTAAAGPDILPQGRDAAEAALRLAIHHQLAWHELDALRAHAALDHADYADNGWAAKSNALYARLVGPSLDSDPLATVEQRIAAQKAAGQAADSLD
jgi:tetratricopeptide (TPR) repeat protein